MSAEPVIKNELRLLFLCIGLGILGLGAYAASKFTPGKLIVWITSIGILGFLAVLILLAIRLKRFWQILAAAGMALASIIVATYLLLFLFLHFFQDAVANQTNSFFQPKTISAEAEEALISPGAKALDLITPDGTHLRGWMVRNSTESQTPLVIYFGGSGSESSEMIPFAKNLKGWSMALVNYRGFGLSEGTPTQSIVLADSLLIYDSLAAGTDIDAEHIVIMGYSLGTGVAVSLSSQRSVAGTILVSPYDYWTLIGAKQTPLYAPLSGFMKHYFNSISLAPEIKDPMLCLIGSNDTSVPPNLSRRLAGAWGGETNVIEYPGEDHGLLFHDNKSWTDIADFLQMVNAK
jgi:pimeloyl-ACP methyl ester carboxylesterase